MSQLDNDTKEKPQCICCFLASNPYACKACWPEGGSEKERNSFLECVAKAREEVEQKENEKLKQEQFALWMNKYTDDSISNK